MTCSAARPPEAGGADASPDGAGPDAAGGAVVVVAPPHAAMMMAAVASKPKRRLCIYVLLRTGGYPISSHMVRVPCSRVPWPIAVVSRRASQLDKGSGRA